MNTVGSDGKEVIYEYHPMEVFKWAQYGKTWINLNQSTTLQWQLGHNGVRLENTFMLIRRSQYTWEHGSNGAENQFYENKKYSEFVKSKE